MPRDQQVITLVAALHHVMQEIPPEKISDFQAHMLTWFSQNDAELCESIRRTGSLSDEEKALIEAHAAEFARQYCAQGREGV